MKQGICEKTRKVFVYAGGGDTEDDLKKCRQENAILKKRLYYGEYKIEVRRSNTSKLFNIKNQYGYQRRIYERMGVSSIFIP